jgi:sugar phosphate isomerase/epimerase
MSRLLLHSMATPDADAAGCLRVAAGLGLDGIELIVDAEYPSAVRPDTTAENLRSLRAAADGLGLSIVALSPYDRQLNAADTADRKRTADALRRAVDIAYELGAQHVRVLPGVAVADEDHHAATQAAAATLRSVAPHAAQAGVWLNLENHMDTLATSAARTRALCDAVDDPQVGILYDQANLAIMGAEQPEDAVARQAGVIRHAHVKNFVPPATDRRPVSLADGVVDWPRTVRALLETGYPGAFTFEYERRWYPGDLPPAEIGLPADRDLLRSLIISTR